MEALQLGYIWILLDTVQDEFNTRLILIYSLLYSVMKKHWCKMFPLILWVYHSVWLKLPIFFSDMKTKKDNANKWFPPDGRRNCSYWRLATRVIWSNVTRNRNIMNIFGKSGCICRGERVVHYSIDLVRLINVQWSAELRTLQGQLRGRRALNVNSYMQKSLKEKAWSKDSPCASFMESKTSYGVSCCYLEWVLQYDSCRRLVRAQIETSSPLTASSQSLCVTPNDTEQLPMSFSSQPGIRHFQYGNPISKLAN